MNTMEDLVCAECGRGSGDRTLTYGRVNTWFACHHCGKPLCDGEREVKGNRRLINIACAIGIDDPAFGAQQAKHCLQCLDHYHPNDAKLVRAGRGGRRD